MTEKLSIIQSYLSELPLTIRNYVFDYLSMAILQRHQNAIDVLPFDDPVTSIIEFFGNLGHQLDDHSQAAMLCALIDLYFEQTKLHHLRDYTAINPESEYMQKREAQKELQTAHREQALERWTTLRSTHLSLEALSKGA